MNQEIPQQNQDKSVDDFLTNDNFIVKKNSHGQEIKWDNFDTIIYDADETIWNCVTKDGEPISAYQTTPPYKLSNDNENACQDAAGNHIITKDGFVDNVRRLKSLGKSLYICSHSENTDLSDDQQPVSLLLNTFGVYDCFDDIIIDGDAPKSTYVEELQDGSTVFVDDDINNLSDVANNTVDVVPLDANKISFEAKNWYRTVISNIIE